MSIFKSLNFWGGLAVALTLLAGIVISVAFWDWFRAVPTDAESNGATIRNVGLLIGGAVALVFGIWRTIVAHQQLDVAQRGLLNDRYQKGAEMLGNNSLAVRLGGIYALRNLANERPDQYHVQVMTLLCALVRHPLQKEEVINEDTQAAMDVIGSRHQILIELEEKRGFVPDLSGAMLHGVNLTRAMLYRAHLSGAVLSEANLSGAILHGSNLPGATLHGSNLSGAMLYEANLSGAMLRGANLSGAMLSHPIFPGTGAVEGLTQAQLDEARSDPGNPPKLDGVLDANGKKLEWCVGSLEEE